MQRETNTELWRDTRMPMRYGEKVLASRGAMVRSTNSQGRAGCRLVPWDVTTDEIREGEISTVALPRTEYAARSARCVPMC